MTPRLPRRPPRVRLAARVSCASDGFRPLQPLGSDCKPGVAHPLMASVFGETMSPVLEARGSGCSPGQTGVLHALCGEKMGTSVRLCKTLPAYLVLVRVSPWGPRNSAVHVCSVNGGAGAPGGHSQSTCLRKPQPAALGSEGLGFKTTASSRLPNLAPLLLALGVSKKGLRQLVGSPLCSGTRVNSQVVFSLVLVAEHEEF